MEFQLSYFFFLFLFYFTILYWFCHTSTCIHHRCTRVPHPEPPSHVPPHTIPLGHPSAPAPSWAISNPKGWCCESAVFNMPENLENSAMATGLKRSVFIPIPKKVRAKECLNYLTISLISHVSKVTLKILQARLQQYMQCELPNAQTEFLKSRGTRDQIVNICRIIKN